MLSVRVVLLWQRLDLVDVAGWYRRLVFDNYIDTTANDSDGDKCSEKVGAQHVISFLLSSFLQSLRMNQGIATSSPMGDSTVRLAMADTGNS
jgi:hypothetical protein